MRPYSYDRRHTFRKASNEDSQELIEQTLEQAEKFIRRAQGIPEVLLELGKVLETPEIEEESRRATKQIEDVKALVLIAKTTNEDISDMDDDFNNLVKELVVKGTSEGITQQLIENRLTRLNKLRALTEEAKKIMGRLLSDDSFIDWDAGNWLNSKVVLHKELRKKGPTRYDFNDWPILEGLTDALESYTTERLKDDVEEDLPYKNESSKS
jgi:hypothetical protein